MYDQTYSDEGRSRWLGRLVLTAVATAALSACGVDEVTPDPNGNPDFPDPPSGYDYVSASPGGGGGGGGDYDMGYYPDAAGDMGSGVVDMAPSQDTGVGPGDPSDPAEVTRGDIFRMLDDGNLLNLNPYRGLQIIDVGDLDHPAVLGQLPIDGAPVELHVYGERAYLLVNRTAHTRSAWDSRPDVVGGAWVLAVDLTDPNEPKLLAEKSIPGDILTSRLVTRDGRAALYVVTSEYGYYDYPTDPWGGEDAGPWEVDVGYGYVSGRTLVTSFAVSAGLAPAATIELTGEVTAVQATPEALMVARNATSGTWDGQSEVALIDISDPDGLMVEGDSVPVAGHVPGLFAMDLYNGVLRVVSTDWSVNTVETFDASDFSDVQFLDEATFGEGENLFATLFLGNKAFFVTFFRQDPFHAFEITDDGEIVERSEFIVSGWNDFFVAAFGGERLLGVGIDQQDWRNVVALSLYDITDLDNAEPLVARVQVGDGEGFSEANLDDRAFTVIEDAVSVEAPDGTLETGLILLPFTSYAPGPYEGMQGGVQIVTFSADTLTLRGQMGEPDGNVRRSFEIEEDAVGNLSDGGLRVFDTTDPEEPVQRGFVELAPNVLDVLDFGPYLGRVEAAAAWLYEGPYPYWGTGARVELVPREANIETAEPVGTIEGLTSTALLAVGDHLVALDRSNGPAQLVVYDVGDPTSPTESARLTHSALDGLSWYGDFECPTCAGVEAPQVVGDDAVAFLSQRWESVEDGTVEECYIYPEEWMSPGCTGGPGPCRYIDGGITCRRENGGPEQCEGELVACDSTWCGDTLCFDGCAPIAAGSVPTQRECYTSPLYRNEYHARLTVLDLSAPASPAITTTALPDTDPVRRVLVEGQSLVYSLAHPVPVTGDGRSYEAWYLRQVDLAAPSAPVLGDLVNIPGEAMDVAGDLVVTRDWSWFEDGTTASVALVELDGDEARLLGRYSLGGREATAAAFDDAGRVLVSQSPAWWGGYYDGSPQTDTNVQLILLGVTGSGLALLDEMDIDPWAEVLAVRGHRVVYQVSGGLLVVDAGAEGALEAAAFHGLPDVWGGGLQISDTEGFFAAGRYGVVRFDLEEDNLR